MPVPVRPPNSGLRTLSAAMQMRPAAIWVTLNAGQQAGAAGAFPPPRSDTVLAGTGPTLPKQQGSSAGSWGPEQDPPAAAELTHSSFPQA